MMNESEPTAPRGRVWWREYPTIARRQLFVVLAVWLATMAVTALVTYSVSPTYRSEVALLASTGGEGAAPSYQGSLFLERVTSYVDLATSRAIMEEVIERSGLDETPGELQAKVSATLPADTVLIKIAAEDSSPSRAQTIAATTADVLVDFVDEVQEDAAGSAVAPIRFATVDPASLPTAPSSPRPVRNLTIAAVLGLLLGLGAALLRHALDDTVTTEAGVEDRAGVKLWGTVPSVPGETKRPLIGATDKVDPRAEAYRMLRTSLHLAAGERRQQVLFVTSPVPDETKATTAANLAIAMGMARERVVLVEADLRSPRIGAYLEVDNRIGLAAVLSGDLDVDLAIQRPVSPLPISVLPAGPLPADSSEVLEIEKFTVLLDRLRQRFDVVIFNGPALLPVWDAAVLASLSDAVLLVVRYGQTTVEQLRESKRRLADAKVEMTGAVLTSVPAYAAGPFGYGKYLSGRHRSDGPDNS